MIDSHTHLDSCRPPNEDLVRVAADAGVRRILTVGMDGESCRSALAAAEAFWDLDAPLRRLGGPYTPVPYAPSLERAWVPDADRIADELRDLAAV